MKKVTFVVLLCAAAAFGYAQDFDDLPFPNPDLMSFFQQEMTSLMRFQVKHDINVPFFLSYTDETIGHNYNKKLSSIAGVGSSGYLTLRDGTNLTAYANSTGLIIGLQFKLNPTFYVPVFLCAGGSQLNDYADKSYLSAWDPSFGPSLAYSRWSLLGGFPGAGVFINTYMFKGGIYAGIRIKNNYIYDRDLHLKYPVSSEELFNAGTAESILPKIAFLPVVNTSNWAYVGKALNYFMGFIGLGDVVDTFEEEGDTKFAAAMSALNLLLDFSFNRMDFNYITINSRAYYQRDNYDAIAKTDTFAIELRGGFPALPIGFIINGGYKHFYTYHTDLASAYHDTGFINGSVYFIVRNYGNVGFTFKYDDITKAKYIFSLSTNFLSGFYGFNPSIKRTRTFDGQEVETEDGQYRGFGFRYRHGGWRVGK